jgi:hypothetical protein
MLLEVGESESESENESENRAQLRGFSGEGWTSKRDIEAFASILFEIVVGRTANGETSVPADIVIN